MGVRDKRQKGASPMIKKHTLAHDPKVSEALEALPGLYATDGIKGDRPAVKLFDMAGSAFWVIWEYDAEADEGFGFGSMNGVDGELGYVPVSELRKLGLRIEKDSSVESMVEGSESRNIGIPEFLMKEKEVV
jgi:hypothetical protein